MMHSSTLLRDFSTFEKEALPAPGLSEADEEAIRAEAHARGVAEGEAQARQAIALETLDAVREMTARLDDLSALKTDIRADVAAEAGAALATVLRQVAPDLAAKGLAPRARALFETELRAAPRPLAILAAPDVAEHLTTLLAGMPDDDFSIKAVEAMPATRIEATWPEGGAVVDVGMLVDSINDLAATLCPAMPDTPAAADPEEDKADD